MRLLEACEVVAVGQTAVVISPLPPSFRRSSSSPLYRDERRHLKNVVFEQLGVGGDREKTGVYDAIGRRENQHLLSKELQKPVEENVRIEQGTLRFRWCVLHDDGRSRSIRAGIYLMRGAERL